MSMMCVTPARAIAAILFAVQIPPPTAIRSVTHVISILEVPSSRALCNSGTPAHVPIWLLDPGLLNAGQRVPTNFPPAASRLTVVAQLLAFILRPHHPKRQAPFPYPG